MLSSLITRAWQLMHGHARSVASTPAEPATVMLPAFAATPDLDRRHEWSFGDRCGGVSDVGRVRIVNEDALFACSQDGLLVVADGMGGHNAGDVASAIAVRRVRVRLSGCRNVDPAGLDAILLDVFADAEAAIKAHAAIDSRCARMGTALIVGLLRGDALVLAHAGDVRGYRLRSGWLTRLTNDHTEVDRMVRAGQITPDAARRHPRSNVLYEVVGGGNRSVMPEITRAGLAAGDVVMLCSDGVWNELTDELIGSTLAGDGSALDLARRLIDLAWEAGGNDNMTALVHRHDVA